MITATATTARAYQTQAVEQLRVAVKQYGSAVYVLPTGGGKTVVASIIAQNVIQRGGKLLFIVHRRELVKQALDTIQGAVPGMEVGIEAAGWPSMPWAPMQIGMVQSLVRREHVRRMEPTVTVIDEAHHARASTWEKVLAWWPTTARLGLTATPERLDGKGLGLHFNAMVEGPNIQQLVKDGYLAPCRTMTIPIKIDTEGLIPNKQGEYGAKIGERITSEVIADAADAYVRYARGRRVIFFGEDRSHSRRVVERLQSLGVKAAHVDGTDHPARRDRIMAEFRDGALEVVGNCDLISEGFDAPGCDGVMLGKHTKSVTRYLQQAGRAMRPGPNKTALILDLAGISYELGLPDEPREWDLADGEVKERRKGKPKPRTCERCRTAYYGPRCPNCAFTPPTMPLNEGRVDLVDATGRTKRAPPKARRDVLNRELHEVRRQSGNQEELMRGVLAIAAKYKYNPRWAGYILRSWGMDDGAGS